MDIDTKITTNTKLICEWCQKTIVLQYMYRTKTKNDVYCCSKCYQLGTNGTWIQLNAEIVYVEKITG